jgi:hypothetical protein
MRRHWNTFSLRGRIVRIIPPSTVAIDTTVDAS